MDKEILIAHVKDCMLNVAESGISQEAYTEYEAATLKVINELSEGADVNANR